ncbi:MAG: hypothetical protein Q8P42_01280 [Gallionella sp.]|nr:hypothetical protein [Gallionella sp.]
MKKIVLSLASVLAATAFAPEAAAIPAYARQTGMACTACHAQHFPILNGFGRAFKAGGYTMMGSQGKVEGEHLSIPDTLNMSMIVKLRYQDNNQASNDGALGKAATSQNKGEGQWQFFDEFALLIGGRIADNVGLFFEGQMLATAPLLGIARMPFVFDMGGAKLSLVPFLNDGGSAMVGYELSSGGVLRANRWSEHRDHTSAIQYNRNVEAATGFAFAAQNDMGFINLTKWAANFGPDGAAALSSNYVRIAATPTVGSWSMVVGGGKMSGSSYNAALGAEVVTDQTFFDLQAQGEVGGNELGVYAQHSKAPSDPVGRTSAYNSKNVTDRKAWTLGVDYTVIPHALSIGAAYRSADNGAASNVNGDDAWTVQAIYDLYQNVALHAVYSKSSGSAHTATTENELLTLMLEMAW